jgi:hypothetical protein
MAMTRGFGMARLPRCSRDNAEKRSSTASTIDLVSVNTPISGLIEEADEFRPLEIADCLGREWPQVFDEEQLDFVHQGQNLFRLHQAARPKMGATPSAVVVEVFQ